MKRKVLSLLLVVTMMLTLVSCGNNSAKPDMDSSVTDSEISVNEGEEGSAEVSNARSEYENRIADKWVPEDEFWIFDENVKAPEFAAVEVTEFEPYEDVTCKLSSTPFAKYDINSIYNKIATNEFIHTVYPDEFRLTESESMNHFDTYTEGNFYEYTRRNFIRGNNNELRSKFSCEFVTDYKYFNGISSIYISLDGVPQNQNAQKGIYELILSIFDDETIAKYLVYAPTTSDNTNQKYEIINNIKGEDDTTYAICREFKQRETYWDIDFDIICYPSFNTRNLYTYYQPEEGTLYESSDCKLTDVIEGTLSDIDLDNYTTMFPEFANVFTGNKYKNKNDLRTGLFDYSKTIYADGSINYSTSLSNLGFLSEVPEDNYGVWYNPELDIDYNITYKDNDIIDFNINVSHDYNYYNVDATEEQLKACAESQVRTIAPNADLSKRTSEGIWLGKPCEFTFSYVDDYKGWRFEVDFLGD